MATVAFVSATYIKEYSFIDPNVDERILRSAIQEAQNAYILEYLGTGLYNELISQVQSGTLTALNTTLIDNYVQPCLVWWAIMEAAPFMTFRFTNKNIVRKNSENSSSIDFNELDKIMGHISYKAQFHSQKLIDYLCENDTDYPLYINPGDGVNIVYPRSCAYDCGIFLGNTRTKPKTYEERFEDK